MFKDYVRKKIEKLTRQYLEAHQDVKLICVGGSVGKTSTKHAIATLLSQRYRVRMQDGNHNSEVSVPLAILGIDFPNSLRNPLAWLGVFRAAHLRVKGYPTADIRLKVLR